jgi:hypothetical protein
MTKMLNKLGIFLFLFMIYFLTLHPGNTKGGSITVPLTSGLNGLD